MSRLEALLEQLQLEEGKEFAYPQVVNTWGAVDDAMDRLARKIAEVVGLRWQVEGYKGRNLAFGQHVAEFAVRGTLSKVSYKVALHLKFESRGVDIAAWVQSPVGSNDVKVAADASHSADFLKKTAPQVAKAIDSVLTQAFKKTALGA